MGSLIREIPLQNGLTLRYYDQTRHYFGDFYLVKLELVCNIPLQLEYFETSSMFDEAKQLIGDSAVYRRAFEQMGVASTAIGAVSDRLIEHFTRNSLTYFSSCSFPVKFVNAELNKARKKLAGRPRFSCDSHG